MELGKVLGLWDIIFDYCDIEDLFHFLLVNEDFYEMIKRKLNIKSKKIYQSFKFNDYFRDQTKDFKIYYYYVIEENFINAMIPLTLQNCYQLDLYPQSNSWWQMLPDCLTIRTWEFLGDNIRYKEYITFAKYELYNEELTPGKLKVLLYTFMNMKKSFYYHVKKVFS